MIHARVEHAQPWLSKMAFPVRHQYRHGRVSDRKKGKLMSRNTSQPNTNLSELEMSRIIDAPVAEVWKAWTEPDYVKQWWGPDGFTCPVANLDVREGGTSLVAMSSPEYGTNYSNWTYEEIVPQQRIVYIHNLADEAGNTVDPATAGMPPDFPQDVRNVVVFEPTDDGKTNLTVTEYADFTQQWHELSKMGQEQCLDKVAQIFEG
jgi:uncharacterized protein YndB with AHSA1/START domain